MSTNNAYPSGGQLPMTPPGSRSQSMRSNEDPRVYRTLPFRRQSSIYEEPGSVNFDQQQQRAISQNPRYSSSISSQHGSRESWDPPRPFASPPPMSNQRPAQVSIDAAQLDELLKMAGRNTGNLYGKTTIEGNARVLQGNLYDGPEPPQDMRKHIYAETINRTRPNEAGESGNRLIQGDASVNAINATGFWTPGPVGTASNQFYFGSPYYQPQHNYRPEYSYPPPPNRMQGQ